jgi:hypothetical protein
MLIILWSINKQIFSYYLLNGFSFMQKFCDNKFLPLIISFLVCFVIIFTWLLMFATMYIFEGRTLMFVTLVLKSHPYNFESRLDVFF